jgi:hypothetical protein
MSIAHKTRIAELEKKMAEYAGMSTIEFRKHLAHLEMRIERLEQARRPGPKPKDGRDA